jgi:spermidine/putrescine transport system permease protein
MAFAAFGHGGGGGSAPSAAPTKKSKVALFLLLPGLTYLGLFFMTPLVSLIITSLQVPDGSGMMGSYTYGFAIENYGKVIVDFWPQISHSFVYAFIATLAALLISYPLAYFIGVKARRFPLIQGLMLTLVIAPFFISFLLRTFAWKQIFSNESASGHGHLGLERLSGRHPVHGYFWFNLQLHSFHDFAALQHPRASRHSPARGWC